MTGTYYPHVSRRAILKINRLVLLSSEDERISVPVRRGVPERAELALAKGPAGHKSSFPEKHKKTQSLVPLAKGLPTCHESGILIFIKLSCTA